MTKQEQIEEMAKIVDEMYNIYTTTAEDIAEGLYNAGYRKIQDGTVVFSREEYEMLKSLYDTQKAFKEGYEKARKETAKVIFQKVINICRKEEDFQDGTVNTQLEPLYFGIINGCAFIRNEVKEIAKHYGVEVEE